MKVINDLLDYNNLKIVQDDQYFNFSLDSVLLPNFVSIKSKTKRILDLGTGNAPIPIILSTMTNAKIYGIYPGSIKDVETINNLNEVDLYFAIDAMGGHIWSCRHNMAHGRIPEIDLTEEQYALEYMVYQTTKFGVELPAPEIDKHINSTPSYWAWFRFYDNHFKNFLTNEQWQAFQKARSNGKDTSAFMPSGHWTDLLEKTETLTKKK